MRNSNMMMTMMMTMMMGTTTTRSHEHATERKVVLRVFRIFFVVLFFVIGRVLQIITIMD